MKKSKPSNSPKPLGAADRFHTYMRGFYCGAGVKALDPKLTGHELQEIRDLYSEGWKDGRAASREAAQKAEKRFGYKPSIIRPAKG